MPKIARTVKALRAEVARWRRRRKTVALVPTMGALHDGHMSLVRLALNQADRVVVSVFVNPAQFGPTEDFGRYPRTWNADMKRLAAAKVDLVFAPAMREIYPEGFATRLAPGGPAVADLEDRFRPHHFGGVATVVTKLLIETTPDWAYFGQKDFQQLLVVRRLARDLDLPVKIVGGPTVREKDGLALSSRNVYLSPTERAAAPALHRALRDSANAIAAGQPIEDAIAAGRAAIEKAGFAPDYLEARHAETLAPIASVQEGPVRLLAAARIGATRLIDNVAVRAKRRRGS
ncbi:MAG TPA: pantoate--beta-alanine ligase [Xanthobacteraceae bacterium]|nr:pantoate--beta-alanine ligase [Xanthobacteraceae bacterium]